jgi:hypothetical protein
MNPVRVREKYLTTVATITGGALQLPNNKMIDFNIILYMLSPIVANCRQQPPKTAGNPRQSLTTIL